MLRHRCLLSHCEDELGRVLGGRGRARMVWNLLREGMDPLEYASALVSTNRSPVLEAMNVHETTMVPHQKSPPGRNLTLRTARELIASGFRMPSTEVANRTVGACGTQKLLLRLQDGLEVETVLIPSDIHTSSNRARTTLCVSR